MLYRLRTSKCIMHRIRRINCVHEFEKFKIHRLVAIHESSYYCSRAKRKMERAKLLQIAIFEILHLRNWYWFALFRVTRVMKDNRKEQQVSKVQRKVKYHFYAGNCLSE